MYRKSYKAVDIGLLHIKMEVVSMLDQFQVYISDSSHNKIADIKILQKRSLPKLVIEDLRTLNKKILLIT